MRDVVKSLGGGILCCCLWDVSVNRSQMEVRKIPYLDFLQSFLKFKDVAGYNDHICALGCQLSRDAKSQALRCTSEQNSLPN